MIRAIAIGAIASWLALGCGGGQPAPEKVGVDVTESDTVASLVELAERAFERGELATAADRYERALGHQPGAVRPRLGLARIALARGQLERAHRQAEAALARAPEDAEALFVLATVERASGRTQRAVELLRRAVRQDPLHVRAHAELAELSGRAPRQLPSDPGAIVRLAEQYPYDPWATLQAARALLASGRPEAAGRLLAARSWLAGLEPRPGLEGLRLLAAIDPSWADRRIVRVHCFADETVRRDPGWAMRLRVLFAQASTSLLPLLDTTFLPVSTRPFLSADDEAAPPAERLELDAIEAAFLRSAGGVPRSGIVAAFTELEPPRGRGSVRLGQAEYLGRRMLVRLEPGELQSRTLLHELLHLYGGVHVSEDVPSLMNPSGEARQLDAANAEIARLVRGRGFGPGGFEHDLLGAVKPQELVEALLRALRLNLHFRQLGIRNAREARRTSRFQALRELRSAVALDEHLGDVASFVARLELQQGYEAAAAHYLEVAAALYGPTSREGRRASELSEQLWRRVESGAAHAP